MKIEDSAVKELIATLKIMAEVMANIGTNIEELQNRVKDLETIYIEEKLLGKQPGKIEG